MAARALLRVLNRGLLTRTSPASASRLEIKSLDGPTAALEYHLLANPSAHAYLTIDLTRCPLPVELEASVGTQDPTNQTSLRGIVLGPNEAWDDARLRARIHWPMHQNPRVLSVPHHAPWVGLAAPETWPRVGVSEQARKAGLVVAGVPLRKGGFASVACVRESDLLDGAPRDSILYSTASLAQALTPYELHNLQTGLSDVLMKLAEVTAAPFVPSVVLCGAAEAPRWTGKQLSGPALAVEPERVNASRRGGRLWTAVQLLQASYLFWGTTCRITGERGPELESAFASAVALIAAGELGERDLPRHFLAKLRWQRRVPKPRDLLLRWSREPRGRLSAALTLWLVEQLKRESVLAAVRVLTNEAWDGPLSSQRVVFALLEAGATPSPSLPRRRDLGARQGEAI